MLRVSIAALIQPTSFKVINLVGRNRMSRLGQARDGKCGEEQMVSAQMV